MFKIQNTMTCFEHLNFVYSDLFRISCFDIRISITKVDVSSLIINSNYPGRLCEERSDEAIQSVYIYP